MEGIVFNLIFVLFFVLGFLLRFEGGKIISVAAGLCLGVIANEIYKFIVWAIR